MGKKFVSFCTLFLVLNKIQRKTFTRDENKDLEGGHSCTKFLIWYRNDFEKKNVNKSYSSLIKRLKNLRIFIVPIIWIAFFLDTSDILE